MLAVLGLGRALAVPVVAEGVETPSTPYCAARRGSSLSGFTPRGTSAIALTPALLEQRGDRG